MNLASPVGQREVLTYKEVQAALGMTFNQVRNLATTNRLRKRYSGVYPFHFEDVNRFIMDLNHGRIRLGRNTKPKRKAEPVAARASA